MDMERKEADKMTIEEARKQKGMSRREVSEWLEIPYRTLSNWSRSTSTCTVILLVGLSCSIAYPIGINGPPEQSAHTRPSGYSLGITFSIPHAWHCVTI